MEEFNMTLNKYLDIAPEVQKALDEEIGRASCRERV